MAGFNMFSDIFGDIREDVNMHYQNEYNRHQTSKAYRRQKEFAQKQIRWSAADAKAAGLHPLYAMGSGTASHSAPQHVGAVRGSNSSNSLPQSTPSAAQERLTKLRGDYVEEQILASRQARENVNNNASPELAEYGDARNIGPIKRGTVKIVPNEITASEDGGVTTAGVRPGWTNVKLAKDLTITVPADEIDSLWESPGIWAPIVADSGNRKALSKWIRKHLGLKEGEWMTHDKVFKILLKKLFPKAEGKSKKIYENQTAPTQRDIKRYIEQRM